MSSTIVMGTIASFDPQHIEDLEKKIRRLLNLLGGTLAVLYGPAESAGIKEAIAQQELLGKAITETNLINEEAIKKINEGLLTQNNLQAQVLVALDKEVALNQQRLVILEKEALVRAEIARLTTSIASTALQSGLAVNNSGNVITKSVKSFAKTPIESALDKERAAGIPDELIRIGKDSRLISASNPLGLGVFNTKDEPKGLSDGIERATKNGRVVSSSDIPNLAKREINVIPHFTKNPIEKALDKERETGVPDTLIRIGKDARLVTSTNPLGLGVFNLRDEPHGLSQGVERAKKNQRIANDSNDIPNLAKREMGRSLPHFAKSPIEQALDRERAAGIPDALIKIGKDARLVSGDNPLGLGVFNLKDEPHGVSQGVDRVAKTGKILDNTVSNFADVDPRLQIRSGFIGGEVQASINLGEAQRQLENFQREVATVTASATGTAQAFAQIKANALRMAEQLELSASSQKFIAQSLGTIRQNFTEDR